jgi:hypothetical protein
VTALLGDAWQRDLQGEKNMMGSIKPIILFFVASTFLLPIGAVIGVIGRKRKAFLVFGVVLMLVSIPATLIMLPVYLWKFDMARGWALRLPSDAPPYTVTLVQKPGDDFYESYFEVTRTDGAKATVWIDGDDSRWWNPDVVQKDGRIYFVRGFGAIGDSTSYVDAANDTIFSGYHQEKLRISELEFK